MIKQIEMIARLTAEVSCQEREREVSLNDIGEMVRDKIINICDFFSTTPIENNLT